MKFYCTVPYIIGLLKICSEVLPIFQTVNRLYSNSPKECCTWTESLKLTHARDLPSLSFVISREISETPLPFPPPSCKMSIDQILGEIQPKSSFSKITWSNATRIYLFLILHLFSRIVIADSLYLIASKETSNYIHSGTISSIVWTHHF